MIDRYPALIARCESVADVAAALLHARPRMEVAVRAGCHSAPGFATTDGGLVIDLSPLKAIHIDPARRIAWVQPGVLWGELDAATQEHGLAVTGGRVSHRRRRLHARLGQRLARAQDGPGRRQPARRARATADRPCRHRVATENPDLFWAIRGGGGNFGIVVEFEFALRPSARSSRRHDAGRAAPARSCAPTATSWRGARPLRGLALMTPPSIPHRQGPPRSGDGPLRRRPTRRRASPLRALAVDAVQPMPTAPCSR